MAEIKTIYYCMKCYREYKTRQHFDRYVNQRFPRGIKCQPIIYLKCMNCGKTYKKNSKAWAAKHRCSK